MAKRTKKDTTEQVPEIIAETVSESSEPVVEASEVVENTQLVQEEVVESQPEVEQVEVQDVQSSDGEVVPVEGETVAHEPKKESAFIAKIKEVFGKKKNWLDEVEGVEIYPSTSNLSTGEKVKRFLKSQSGWLFVLPAVVLMCIFTLYPIVNAFIGAFKQNYNALTGSYDGWGFENFVRVLKADTGTGGASFLQCLVNTVVFTLISVPLSTLLALLISVALTSIKPLQKAYQTVLFLPYLTNALAMGAVFATFFKIIGTRSNTETVGLVNMFLGWFNIDPIDWVGAGSPHWEWGALSIPWAKYIVVIVYEVWAGLPFKILILFSSLQSVNKQYYDAAKIDGASKNTILWKITAPMISPMISYLLVTGIMGGMKQYSAVVGIFGADMGIDYDMGTMVGYIYQFINDGHTGYAFAGSLMLFLIIMVFTGINRYVSKKKVKF